MVGAMDEFFKVNPATDKQNPDAFGRIDLMTCQGKKVHFHFPHIHRDLTCTLGCITVKWYPMLSRNPTDLFNLLDRAGFIVCMQSS